MALVYAFLIIFLFIMLAIINSYSDKNKFLEAIDDKINVDIGVDIDGKSTLLNKILEDNVALSTTNINFSSIANTVNGRGLFFETDDDGKRTYFFRGEVSNNYIIFGREFENNEDLKGKKICWRILHTNEDNSIRLLYSGLLDDNGYCSDSQTYIADNIAYNSKSDDNAYVGYTYGEANQTTFLNTHYYVDKVINELNTSISQESLVKKEIDMWYKNNTDLYLYNNLVYGDEETNLRDNYIADAKFCADRSIKDDNSGYGQISTIYGGMNRISSNQKPTYDCSLEDSYSLSVSEGGTNTNIYALSTPVGLLTVDEVRYAGGAITASNNKYFLYNGKSYWTMSPHSYSTSSGANVFYISSNGSISSQRTTNLAAIRPVISIKSDTLIDRGTGYMEDPYVVW